MGADRALTQSFLREHPSEGASILERFPGEQTVALLVDVPAETAARILQQIAAPAAVEFLAEWPADRARAIVSALPVHHAALLLRAMDEPRRERFLSSAGEETVSALRLLLRYPEDTAGALMEPRVFPLPEDVTVAEARLRLRRFPGHASDYLYVVSRERKLEGAVDLGTLVLAKRHASLGALMTRNVARIPVGAHRSTVLAHPGWRRFHALPVVDDAGVLVGVIPYKSFRRLEDEQSGARAPGPLGMALALGELYWIGTAGLFQGMLNALKQAAALDEEKSRGA